MPFQERGTQELLDRVVARRPAGALRAGSRTRPRRATSCSRSARRAFSHIEIDISDIRAALDSLLPVLRPGHHIVLRSTVAPGTTEFVAGYLEQQRGLEIGSDVFVAHAPERIAENHFVEEIAIAAAHRRRRRRGVDRAGRAPVRGVRIAHRAHDAGAGRAGEDLDQHLPLRELRASQPPDDELRAVRRERVRGDRPDQPRLSARRDRDAGADGRHLPAQGLRVLGGALERARHADVGLARERERAAVPGRGDQAAGSDRCGGARSRSSDSRSSATPTTCATRCRRS